MNILKQSTATTLLLGPFVDETDGQTVEDALTISQADVLLWKEGGTTLAQKNDATSCTSRSSTGLYTCPVNTTDTNTLGLLSVFVNESGAIPIRHDYRVVPANVYDSLILGTDILDVSMTQILGTAVSTPATAGILDINLKNIANATVSTTSAQLGVNVVQISTDATAADNAELFFDGTGYAGGTTKLGVDIVSISGDTTSADNLESYTDGTTPQPVNATQISGDATAADNLEAAYDGAGYAGGTIPQQVILTTSGNNAVADQVWDEAMSGHVAAGSAGAAQFVIRSATALASGTDSTHLALDASASAVDDFYNNQKLVILSGTGALQSRFISDYVGATKIATVSTWITTPDGTSVYAILPFGSIPGATAPTAGEVADAVWDEAIAGHTTEATYGALAQSMSLQVGSAQAGAASSITLDATGVPSSSATNDNYKYQMITIRSGTGIGQTRQITAYNGTTKVATVNLPWTVEPISGSEYVIHPGGLDAATVAALADAVWDEARSGHVASGSFGEYTLADVTRLSGDATAADNAEAFFDGTGYAGTGNVIPSVTTVTGNVNGNVGGNVTGSVGSVTGNVGGSVATVTALAANSITAAATAADFTTEVTAGLATASALSTAQTAITAIKAKTDSLTFTTTNIVDANIQQVNDVTVNGNGAGTPWGP